MRKQKGALAGLIGTVHLDPAGEARLRAALGTLRPQAVTVDVSPYAIEFRLRRGEELRGRLDPFRGADGTLPPGLEAVSAQLLVPYEWTAAAAYAAETGIPAEAVGDSGASREWLELLENELLAPANLARLAREEVPILSEQVAWEYATARRHWREGKATGEAGRERLRAADTRMANLLAARPDRKGLVHVTGWEHLAGLSAALELPPARCALLCDFSSFGRVPGRGEPGRE